MVVSACEIEAMTKQPSLWGAMQQVNDGDERERSEAAQEEQDALGRDPEPHQKGLAVERMHEFVGRSHEYRADLRWIRMSSISAGEVVQQISSSGAGEHYPQSSLLPPLPATAPLFFVSCMHQPMLRSQRWCPYQSLKRQWCNSSRPSSKFHVREAHRGSADLFNRRMSNLSSRSRLDHTNLAAVLPDRAKPCGPCEAAPQHCDRSILCAHRAAYMSIICWKSLFCNSLMVTWHLSTDKHTGVLLPY
eukprot:1694026-Rhodomonas_salina.1